MTKLKYRIYALAMVFAFFVAGCVNNSSLTENSGEVKNIIFIIGDGMGVSHMYGAMTVYAGEMNITELKNIGFCKTHSYDNYITDSAASGTALATGSKTRNGMIGLAPDSTKLVSLIELGHLNGLAGGVVSTSAVTHATPASFVAHNISRNNYEEIAEDFLITQPEVFIGGGFDNFAKRIDGKDLVTELENQGYDVVVSIEELLEVDSDKVAGLLAPGHMPKISEGRGDMLANSAKKAIEILSKNEKGFFLMIEASQIDWGGHAHDTPYIIEETIDLDKTLGVVLDFAKQNGETLIVVTADHETGGMTLTGGNMETHSVEASYSTGGHTGICVPVYSFGPQSTRFTGFFDNTEIFEKFAYLLSLKE
ncbi:MAG: alkaline phosphatase [Bacteroidales bacterium]|nr:alkaline phosphatase [Bacteroidales bacterium]